MELRKKRKTTGLGMYIVTGGTGFIVGVHQLDEGIKEDVCFIAAFAYSTHMQ